MFHVKHQPKLYADFSINRDVSQFARKIPARAAGKAIISHAFPTRLALRVCYTVLIKYDGGLDKCAF